MDALTVARHVDLARNLTVVENQVAGGDGMMGVNGTLTGLSTASVFTALAPASENPADGVFLDVGAGTGRCVRHLHPTKYCSD